MQNVQHFSSPLTSWKVSFAHFCLKTTHFEVGKLKQLINIFYKFQKVLVLVKKTYIPVDHVHFFLLRIPQTEQC